MNRRQIIAICKTTNRERVETTINSLSPWNVYPDRSKKIDATAGEIRLARCIMNDREEQGIWSHLWHLAIYPGCHDDYIRTIAQM